jgi:tetratricopeptide (TPR) repeat protein
MLRFFFVLVLGCMSSACGVRDAHTLKQPQNRASQAGELFEQGVSFAREGDFTRAEQYLALALREGHDADRTLRVLLAVCVRASRLRSALLYATPHLTAHPQDWALRQLVASVHLALGDHVSARRELERVIAQRPNAAEAHFLLALIFMRVDERSHEARAHFARYLALAPQGAHADEARAALSSWAAPDSSETQPTSGVRAPT